MLSPLLIVNNAVVKSNRIRMNSVYDISNDFGKFDLLGQVRYLVYLSFRISVY